MKKQNKVAKQTIEKPVEKAENKAPKAAHIETAAKSVKSYQNRLLPFVFMLSIATFVALTFLASTTNISFFDLRITLALQSLNYLPITITMRLVGWIGYAPQSFIILVLSTMLLFKFGLHLEALVSLIASIFIQALNMLAKIIIHRPRPSADMVHVYNILSDYSYPSGHVMFYTVFFGFNWFLAFTLLTHSWKRTLLLIFFGSFVLTIGVSRIYLGFHWLSDVAGAYILGGIVLAGTIMFYRWGKNGFSQK